MGVTEVPLRAPDKQRRARQSLRVSAGGRRASVACIALATAMVAIGCALASCGGPSTRHAGPTTSNCRSLPTCLGLIERHANAGQVVVPTAPPVRFVDGTVGAVGVNSVDGWIGTLNFTDDRSQRPFSEDVYIGAAVPCPPNDVEAPATSPGGRVFCYGRTSTGFSAKYRSAAATYLLKANDLTASPDPKQPSQWAMELVDSLA